MTEPIFFEIPIYRVSFDIHISQMRSLEEKYYGEYKKINDGKCPEDFKFFIKNKFCYPWNYNEIIGYLNLYIYGSQFRAEHWLILNKRINRGIIKKQFKYCGKSLERRIDFTKSSIEIYEWILVELNELQKREFKKREFDLRAFKIAGKFIDWKTLCHELNRFSNENYRVEFLEGHYYD